MENQKGISSIAVIIIIIATIIIAAVAITISVYLVNIKSIQNTSSSESLPQDSSSSQSSITVLPLLAGITITNGSGVHVIWKTEGKIGNIGIGFCPQGQPVGSSGCTADVSYDNTGSVMVSLSGQFSLSSGNWVVHVIDTTNKSIYGVDSGYFTVQGGPSPLPKDCKVKTYQDKFISGVGEHCLDKIVIIKGVYFVAKNQSTGIKSYWEDNMLNIFTQIKNFYGSQFNNKIQINIDTPIIIYGDKNIEEYNQYLIDVESRTKINIDKSNFVVLMYYPIQGESNKNIQGNFGGGGEVDNSSSAMNSWFWLDPDMMKQPDYQGAYLSAHEFGHALGIPHPWEEEANKDNNGNIINPSYGNDEIGSLMSYGGQKPPLVPNSFIRDDVKNKMIIQ